MADDHRDEGGAGKVPAGKGKEKRRKKGHLYAIAILCIVLIVIAAALVTLTVQADLPPEPGTTYPYTTTYAVLIPEGKPVSIAGMEIIVLASGDEMLMRIGDRTEKFVVGETKTISERHAVFRTLGIGIFSTNYRIGATYRGKSGGLADFYIVIATSRQVPSFLIERVLPPSIQARAI